MMREVTVATITAEVERIAKLAAVDPEVAHGLEDQLLRTVLGEIASGNRRGTAQLAAAAMEATKLEYPRWYS